VKIAFIAPFYGPMAAGGAEAECRHTAHHLAGDGLTVHVLTTCLLDLQYDWNVNVHRAGVSRDGPITVHRFRVEPAHLSAFARLNQRLIAGDTLTEEEEETFAALHITSFDLLRYLHRHAAEYDRLLFIPYLFGTTLHGLPLCRDRAVLIPCLHDEGYARMRIVRRVFEAASQIIYHTKAERDLALRLYGSAAPKGTVLGEGVTMDFPSDPAQFRSKFRVTGPFVLCVGRKDPTKNTHLLVDYFSKYARTHANDLKLVFIGPGRVSIPADLADRIVDLGYVSENDKRNAYSAALALCQPSRHESFSIVMMEAWACGTPCLVNEACEVTRAHVRESGGGLYFRDARDFEQIVNYLLENPAAARALGAAGKNYARTNFSWPIITARYRHLLSQST
jgi:glycosyltransferase involved in cell wall biosynthesis